ncbi:MAG: hypothetical protein GWO20_03260 [Candidatus Korarchaeota archaeon]|nr:hypothetical protein [Candidatus Korarchaeota archaeon]NIU82503.1 hypothetical protein [Candidatus Thorarchaeota archaeon]NIW12991.1 hypothetical protein [Candidatus Thorarchaeota archaeon]NIW51141.1 hypothetical protein [Candidatus Korarchaeota archaeon]
MGNKLGILPLFVGIWILAAWYGSVEQWWSVFQVLSVNLPQWTWYIEFTVWLIGVALFTFGISLLTRKE